MTEQRRRIARKLKEVIDPELGVNIVDLGLVYDILIEDGQVTIIYTTTTPGCPMRRYLQQQIDKALTEIEGIESSESKLVMEPEWSVDMIVPDVEFFAVPPPQLNQ
ncbi:metal-sulfur cluster assembly factor [Gracilimonas mengyeensis]|uniref:Metal-sulfur cluster biosynthetic enzyme n=1 Tax=Gracilimonas mengyeensis TaxID=1302730 RepID=A0A521D1K1_9BACT|nr:metal-sulfur cluster assembly factor [Gracilimonas mengyeensis]SMO65577.1 Metal-sulfur cluster biosynthetic enzyme [Gracilimonas mengyeensis]